MPHKYVSSSAALKTSVALLREGIGPTVSNAFVLAPLWVPGVGCIGIFTIVDIPYARPPPAAGRGGGGQRSKHGTPHSNGGAKRNLSHRQQHGGGLTNLVVGGGGGGGGGGRGEGGTTLHEAATAGGEGAPNRVRYVVGAGVVEFARRVGVALGTAVFRLRKKSLVTSIRVEGGGCSIYGSDANRNGSTNRLRMASSLSPPPSSLVPPREVGPRQGSKTREAPVARGRR